MKGIILAGGSGTRLYPTTKWISKHLLPVYDQPMIAYPLAFMQRAGIRDILIVSAPTEQARFQSLLGDSATPDIQLSYAVQSVPNGLAGAIGICRDFIGRDACTVLLGDNLFYGEGIMPLLHQAFTDAKNGKASVFLKEVSDPLDFGVAELDEMGKVISLEEKPIFPKSNFAVLGLYCYPSGVFEMIDGLSPSERGEIEITSLNEMYRKQDLLTAHCLSRDDIWMDMGTAENLFQASSFVREMKTKGISLGLPEIYYN